MSAFTSVSVRKNFSSNPIASPAPSSAPAKMDWPDPVRRYVQRSFIAENSIDGISKEEMTVKLKSVINSAVESGQLHTVDWAQMPLPQHFILQDRAHMSLPPPGAAIAPAFQSYTARDDNIATNPSNTRKRKSLESESDDAKLDSTPPWKQAQKNKNPFEDRLSYSATPLTRKEKKQKRLQEQVQALRSDGAMDSDLEKRRLRFGAEALADKPAKPSPTIDESPRGPVVGTCETLEKRYFRLTAPPKPETVRPLRILKEALKMLKGKWKSDGNYNYICDQFKSLRQDLTVQRIRNEFTVEAYEVHARIALEKGDLGEYNQCQTQLRALYKQNLGGNPSEFLAYRILYFIYTSNRPDMNSLLAGLTAADREHQAVRHALQTRSALALGNYHRFFRLYLEAPSMGGYLMDMFIVRERLAAVDKLCRGYKQTVNLGFITEELAFDSDEECAQFLCEHGGEQFLDKKDNVVHFATAKALQIFHAARAAAFRSVDIKGQI